jgi:hypothetical protein
MKAHVLKIRHGMAKVEVKLRFELRRAKGKKRQKEAPSDLVFRRRAANTVMPGVQDILLLSIRYRPLNLRMMF